MQIGQAAAASGISAKMIRHYEAIGLLAQADRGGANYRVYGTADVYRLRFIRRARDLGFSIERVRALLRLWSERGRSSADVKRIALDHLAELDRKIADLRGMAETLRDLADACDGSTRPDCPILQDLEGQGGGAPVAVSEPTGRPPRRAASRRGAPAA